MDLLLLSEIDGVKISDEHVREEVETFMFEAIISLFKFFIYSFKELFSVLLLLLLDIHVPFRQFIRMASF